jgi:hypothetical protein
MLKFSRSAYPDTHHLLHNSVIIDWIKFPANSTAISIKQQAFTRCMVQRKSHNTYMQAAVYLGENNACLHNAQFPIPDSDGVQQ